MRLALAFLFLVATFLANPYQTRAWSATVDVVWYGYEDPHPIPGTDFWCTIEGEHQHSYELLEENYPVVSLGTSIWFVGDPYLWGWHGSSYWYYGHHPWSAHWCLLDGPHTHLYEPYGSYSYWSDYGGYWSWYGGYDSSYWLWWDEWYTPIYYHHTQARRRWASDHKRGAPLGEERYDRVAVEYSQKQGYQGPIPEDPVVSASISQRTVRLDPSRLPTQAPVPPDPLRSDRQRRVADPSTTLSREPLYRGLPSASSVPTRWPSSATVPAPTSPAPSRSQSVVPPSTPPPATHPPSRSSTSRPRSSPPPSSKGSSGSSKGSSSRGSSSKGSSSSSSRHHR